MTLDTANLSSLFSPRAVAIVGASQNSESLRGRTLAYLIDGFSGDLYPVNPGATEIQGLPCYPTVTDLPTSPDLAIIVTPAPSVPSVLDQCGARGVGAALILSSGFAETGPEGKSLQDEIARLSRHHGIRVCGPNCNGLISWPNRLLATIAPLHPATMAGGPVAIATQSGAAGATIRRSLGLAGVGVDYLCATGNQADVTVGDVLAYYAESTDARVLVAFAESDDVVAEVVELAPLARRHDKPIILLKVGRSAVGAEAALTHTGTIAQSGRLPAHVLGEFGVLQAATLRDVVVWATAFSGPRRPASNRTAVITASGGLGILAADLAEEAGLEVPSLGAHTEAALRNALPPFGSPRNPVDITGQSVNDPSIFEQVIEAVAASPAIDSICFAGIGGGSVVGHKLDVLRRLVAASSKPFLFWTGGADPTERAHLNEAGIPTFDDPSDMVEALRMMLSYTAVARDIDSVPPVRDTSGGAAGVTAHEEVSRPSVLTEVAAKEMLSAYEIPTVSERVADLEQDFSTWDLDQLTFPLVLKIVSSDLPHKSDVGGVELNIGTKAELGAAAMKIRSSVRTYAPHAELDGWVVQEHVSPRIELSAGVRRDRNLGPLVTVGLGGYLIEVVREQYTLPAPVSHPAARRAIANLCGGRLLTSSRGLTPEEADAMADLLVHLGALVSDTPWLESADLNPVAVADGRVVVLDALMTTRSTPAS